MSMKEVVEGLNILRQYFDDPDGYHLGAEHDTIHVYTTDHPVSTEDVKTLRELGWEQENVDEDDFDADEVPYAPEEGWYRFV